MNDAELNDNIPESAAGSVNVFLEPSLRTTEASRRVLLYLNQSSQPQAAPLRNGPMSGFLRNARFNGQDNSADSVIHFFFFFFPGVIK